MNKNEQAQSKDVFGTYKDTVDKTFDSINQSVPRYHQSITNTQQEIIKALEGNVMATIQMQKDIAVKAGIPTTVPDAGIKAIKETTESYLKLAAIYNQLALSSIEAVQQGVKSVNENTKSLNDINQNIIRSWITAFTASN